MNLKSSTTPFRIIFCAVGLSSASLGAAQSDSNEIVLSHFENPLVDEWKGNEAHEYPLEIEFNPDFVKQGDASAKWIIDRSAWLTLREVPADWASAFAISMWIYAEAAIGQDINFVIDAGGQDDTPGYFIHQIPITWDGWNEVIVPLSEFKSSKDGISLENVTSFRITAQGWNANRIPAAILYLDDLKLLL